MHAALEAIQSSPLSQLLASERWANSKQILETLHFIAFALQIGAVMVISLRLLGFGRRVPIAVLSRPVFWTAWLGFAAVFVTGVLQFIPIATEVFYRPSFRAKIAVLAVSACRPDLVAGAGPARRGRLGCRSYDSRFGEGLGRSLAGVVADRRRSRSPHVCLRADGGPLRLR